MTESTRPNITFAASPDIADLMEWCRCQGYEYKVDCRIETVTTTIDYHSLSNRVYFCDARATTPDGVSVEAERLPTPEDALDRVVSHLRGKRARR